MEPGDADAGQTPADHYPDCRVQPGWADNRAECCVDLRSDPAAVWRRTEDGGVCRAGHLGAGVAGGELLLHGDSWYVPAPPGAVRDYR